MVKNLFSHRDDSMRISSAPSGDFHTLTHFLPDAATYACTNQQSYKECNRKFVTGAEEKQKIAQIQFNWRGQWKCFPPDSIHFWIREGHFSIAAVISLWKQWSLRTFKIDNKTKSSHQLIRNRSTEQLLVTNFLLHSLAERETVTCTFFSTMMVNCFFFIFTIFSFCLKSMNFDAWKPYWTGWTWCNLDVALNFPHTYPRTTTEWR